MATLRASTSVKLPDCCVLLTAGAQGGALASFDDKLRVAAADQGLRVIPSAA